MSKNRKTRPLKPKVEFPKLVQKPSMRGRRPKGFNIRKQTLPMSGPVTVIRASIPTDLNKWLIAKAREQGISRDEYIAKILGQRRDQVTRIERQSPL